jgi:gelsolin
LNRATNIWFPFLPGKFYNGDSYIILNTYKEEDSDALLYDVHFWIGKYSTQDEYGTAAYKTVELDTLLDDKPVQHREVQGHEVRGFLVMKGMR